MCTSGSDPDLGRRPVDLGWRILCYMRPFMCAAMAFWLAELFLVADRLQAIFILVMHTTYGATCLCCKKSGLCRGFDAACLRHGYSIDALRGNPYFLEIFPLSRWPVGNLQLGFKWQLDFGIYGLGLCLRTSTETPKCTSYDQVMFRLWSPR